MPAPRFLARRLVLPLQERLRGRTTLRFLRWMRRNDQVSPANLSELHDRLLVEHLKRSAQTVPYYRERVDAAQINSADDLKRFPVLSKAEVREAGERLIADDLRGEVFTMETGGSTGEPLRFFTHRNRESSQIAARLRGRWWWGVPPGLRETQFWGSPIELCKSGTLRTLAERLMGFQLLSAFNLNDQTMAEFRHALEGGRADLVHGYPTVLARYARFLEARGEDLSSTDIRLVVATAENLLPEDAADIRRVFHAPVANEYGCREGAVIAHDSPEGLHLMHDAVHLEVMDPDLQPLDPGIRGEAILTNLHARACPLIRYRLGDLVRLDPDPPQGSVPHPRLLELSGRTTDSLVKDDGSRVHGLALIYILRELPGVEHFRCIQKTQGSLRIEIVPGPTFNPNSVESGIVARVHRVLGPGTTVEVHLEPHLDPGPSGKHRHILCEVDDT